MRLWFTIISKVMVSGDKVHFACITTSRDSVQTQRFCICVLKTPLVFLGTRMDWQLVPESSQSEWSLHTSFSAVKLKLLANLQYIVYCILCTVYCVLCIVYCIVYCVLYCVLYCSEINRNILCMQILSINEHHESVLFLTKNLYRRHADKFSAQSKAPELQTVPELKQGVFLASRRGQILLAVFLCNARFAHAACHCFNSGALLCAGSGM